MCHILIRIVVVVAELGLGLRIPFLADRFIAGLLVVFCCFSLLYRQFDSSI